MLRKMIQPVIWNFLSTIYRYLLNRYLSVYYVFVQRRYKKIVLQVQKKEKIKVAFFLIHEAVWKYEGLYRLLEKDNRFDPLVIVCPYMVFTEENMLREMDQAYDGFLEKDYQVIRTYNKATNKWLDVKHQIKPDIIFYCVPHNITKAAYSIKYFLNTLSCYVPYTFQTTFHYQQNYNAFFHNVLWRAYYPSIIHYNMAVQYGLNKGRNSVLSGYPVIDRFLKFNSSGKKINKIIVNNNSKRAKKNIIWAPHHTIEGNGYGYDLHFSNFIRYHNFMKEIAIKFQEKVFITFKPHPALRPKLSDSNIWGVEKTEKYYSFWQENDFCALNQGNYLGLFEDSDAMIHDCDSFMGEYLSLNKPVLYTRRDDTVEERMNEFGRSALKMHYQARSEEEILKFIDEVVIPGVDPMKSNRTKFIGNFILPPNHMEASMNIFMDLKKSLDIN